jgi:uncharacterized protein YqeY
MAETLKARMREDLNNARRARDKDRTTLLTTILSDLKYREVELGREATDAEVIDIVSKGIKRRREAAEQMRAGNRIDLAEKEEAEAAALSVYLPAQMSEAEVRSIIRQAIDEGANTIGAVMGRIAPRIKGSFDGKEANRIAREMLGA